MEREGLVSDNGGIGLRRADELARLRRWLRSVADRLGLSSLDTARIALAASEAARAGLQQGRAPRAAVRLLRHHDEALLTVEFVATQGAGPLPVPDALSPVTAHSDPAGALLVQLRLPSNLAGRDDLDALEYVDQVEEFACGEGDDSLDLEQELRATLADADERVEQVRRLNEELEETNRGVVALYIELEERDEQLRRAHRAVFRELEDALRPPPPNIGGIELGVAYLPAQENAPTGGDLYDWLVLPTGDLHVTVVDVMGHGVASTRDALSVTHTIRTLSLEGHSFPDLIERANRVLESHNPALVATVLLARVDPATGVVQVAGGSHPPLLALNPGEEPRYVEARGRGMGYPEAGSEAIAALELRPNGLALLYTDGLIESTRDIIEGMDRLPEVAADVAKLPTPEIPKTVVDRMLSGGAHTDDTLAISVRWKP